MARTTSSTNASQSLRRAGHPAFAPRSLVSALMLGSCLTLPMPLAAQLPVGPNLVSGTAAIGVLGNQMTVTNSPSAIINWQGFSIGASHGVHFAQQNAASQVLNRVTGRDPSSILGSLTSNGGVWLINPHGVLFGKGARVDVGGLVASTLDIADADFLANRFRFDTAGPIGSGVLNQGEIRTSFGGRAWLLGEQVRNEGLVEAPGGEIVLAAGKGVEIVDSGTPNVVVKVRAPEGKAVNLGSLIANGGRVDVHAGIVNQDGIVHADSIGVDANGEIVLQASSDLTLGAVSETRATGGRVQLAAKTLNSRGKVKAKEVRAAATDLRQQGTIEAPGGRIVLSAQALAAVAGVVDAADPAGAGGTVEVTGNSVRLAGATVDASGGTQGGTVHLGGGWQGSGALPHAREVVVDADSVVRANGGAGQGGEIVLWSTGRTELGGSLEARDGGRIEVSSKGVMDLGGAIDAGPGGEVLFDPKNLIVDWEGEDGGIDIGDAIFAANPADTSYIEPDTITDLLNQGVDVTLQANNDITVLAGVYVDSGSPGDLTMQAGRNIAFQAPIYDVGNLTAVAGDPAADPANTDPGTPTIRIAHICGVEGGCSYTIDADGLTTLAAIGGNVINSAGDDAIAGRFLIYAADPATSLEGFSSYNKHYNQTYTPGRIPSYARSGDWFMYSIAATISVTPDSHAITYSDPLPTFTPTLAGFIDGDTEDSAGITGTPTWGVAGPYSTSGNPTAGLHDVRFTGGLASRLGYRFTDDAASRDELAVDPLEITASVSVDDKIYDGTTAATLVGISSDILPGDVVTFTGPAAFRDKNVGVDKPVDVTELVLGGPDGGNYLLVDGTGITTTADILARALTAAYTAADKVYDGTTAATVTGTSADVLPGDLVSFSQTAAFRDPNVGVSKPVDVTAITLGGADAGNYALQNATAVALADITGLGLAFSYTASDKVYDGTTAATVAGTLTGILPGEEVTLSESAAFRDKNVGVDKPVDIWAITLGGGDAGNYTLPGNTALAAADITPRDLTADYTAADKVYDGTTAATVSGTSADVLAGDAVTFTQTAAFRDENVGADKPVDVTAIALGGADAGNYVLLNETAFAFADITPLGLDPSLVGEVSKVYDATRTATVAGQNLGLAGFLEGDGVALAVTGNPFYDTRDVGTGKAVTVPGLVLTGPDAGNYSLPTDSLTANIGTITAATLTYLADSLTAPTGVPVAGLTSGTVAGLVGEDTLATATTGTLAWTTPATADSAAGIYPVAGGGLAATNYVFVQAPANVVALRLVDLNDPESPLPFAVETAVQGERTAADLAQAEVDPASGYVMDRTPTLICAETPSFDTLNLSGLSREEAQQLLESRKECKKQLFADAIEQLEKNPNLADVSLCASAAEAQTGRCRLTDAQREQAAAADGRPSPYRVRVAKLPQIERKLAVLFGIDQYADRRIPTLDNALSDADAVGRVLSQKLGYEVRVVRNATKADIVRALNELATEAEPTDSVVVYYAGHGDVIEKTGIGYWLPSDASAEDAKQWLSNDDISRMLSGIKARQLAMISDSCYSGTFAKEQKVALGADRVRPETVLTRRSVIVMSSGGNEPVADSGRGGHSIFAWYLMQDLGKVNNWQPGTAVFPSIQREVSRAFPQTPQYGASPSAGHEQGGDYLFEFRQLEKGG